MLAYDYLKLLKNVLRVVCRYLGDDVCAVRNVLYNEGSVGTNLHRVGFIVYYGSRITGYGVLMCAPGKHHRCSAGKVDVL